MILLISEEATGRVKVKSINGIDHLIVPIKKLDTVQEASNIVRGRTISGIKINGTLNKKQYMLLNTYLLPIMSH